MTSPRLNNLTVKAKKLMVELPPVEAFQNQAVHAAITYMAENLGSDITVGVVAQKMRYSKFHASRVFNRVVGMTPGRYLSEMRLRHAARVFAAVPGVSVTDTATLVGYTSIGTFSTRFSTFFGVSPTQYRQSRCRCGAFDSYEQIPDKDHSYSGFCRAKTNDDGEKLLCTRCHSCLAKLVATTVNGVQLNHLLNKLLKMETMR